MGHQRSQKKKSAFLHDARNKKKRKKKKERERERERVCVCESGEKMGFKVQKVLF